MRTKAAVLYTPNEPIVIEEIDVASPRRGEALIRVLSAGVCHSEVHVIRGRRPAPLPAVLGHEGAGIVEDVGPDVTAVKPGDHVVLLWRTPCGRCHFCATGRPALCEESAKAGSAGTMPDGTIRFSKDGQPIYHFIGPSCFSQYTVIHENALVPIPNDFPMPVAAIMGCGVITGVGAVVNSAKVPPGSTVAVFGVGGVGLSAVMGANLVNASQIIAVDLNPRKLDWAMALGASHTVNASECDSVKAILELTDGRGVDFAFEAIGQTAVVEQAFDATARGGMTVMIGSPRPEAQIRVPARIMFGQERVLRGSYYGSTRPYEDIPWLVRLYRSGRLPLDKLISRHYPLDEYNEAVRALEAGEVARSVLDIMPM